MMHSSTTVRLVSISVVAFLFSFLWENFQAPLYLGYSGFARHFPTCLLAALVDALIVSVIYLGVSRLKGSLIWMALVGGMIAIGIEKWALFNGIWQYTSAMPLLPFFRVGTLPVLQLMLTPVLSAYFAKAIIKKYNN
jgi:hypothetical protein